MSRFSVAAVINWSDHYSTECSPYSWKLFWHNWFTLTSAYLFIATASPGQQSVRGERWDMLTDMYHCARGMHKAQKLKHVWVAGNCSGTIWAASFSIRVQLVKNTPGMTHLRAAAASAVAVGPKQRQAQHGFGETQQLLEQNWGSKVAVSKTVFPILEWDTSAFSWLKITQVPHLFIRVVFYISFLCWNSNSTRQCNGISLED